MEITGSNNVVEANRVEYRHDWVGRGAQQSRRCRDRDRCAERHRRDRRDDGGRPRGAYNSSRGTTIPAFAFTTLTGTPYGQLHRDKRRGHRRDQNFGEGAITIDTA